MDTLLTNLEHNRMDNNHWENYHREGDPNLWNQHNQGPSDIDRDLVIKIVIPEYKGKMQPETFMDWFVCVKRVLAHNLW